MTNKVAKICKKHAVGYEGEFVLSWKMYCRICSREKSLKYRYKNRDSYKIYYAKNKEEIKKKNKIYYIDNKEHILNRSKDYRRKNAEKVNLYGKKWRTLNKEKSKDYQKKSKKKSSESVSMAYIKKLLSNQKVTKELRNDKLYLETRMLIIKLKRTNRKTQPANQQEIPCQLTQSKS